MMWSLRNQNIRERGKSFEKEAKENWMIMTMYSYGIIWINVEMENINFSYGMCYPLCAALPPSS